MFVLSNKLWNFWEKKFDQNYSSLNYNMVFHFVTDFFLITRLLYYASNIYKNYVLFILFAIIVKFYTFTPMLKENELFKEKSFW